MALFAAVLLTSACTATAPSTAIAPEVQVLLDKVQIEELVTEYYTQLGTGGKGYSDFYLEDSVLDVDGQVAQGSEAIEYLYRRAGADVADRKGTFRVMLTNIRININGNTVTADMLWTGVNSETVEAFPIIIEQGRERNALRR